ncbi:MAG: diguanylate cyclase domain-containing protein, partial [Anaerolineales bacterium]
LIIEDDRDTARFFKAVLDLVGFECSIVFSAREALNWLASITPDLILLDMRLGIELGGEDILFQIRSNPRFDNTRVVIITAYPGMVDNVDSLADLVLLKPVEVDHLKVLLERLGSLEVSPRRRLFRDPVTEIFNREFFLTRLELAYERKRRRTDFLYGVLVIEIHTYDPDRELDDDAIIDLLRLIAQRLKENLRPTDTLARLSGWRFVALVEELKHIDDLNTIITRVDDHLKPGYQVDDKEYRLNISYGAVLNQANVFDPTALLQAAEKAAEQAAAQDHPNIHIIAR